MSVSERAAIVALVAGSVYRDGPRVPRDPRDQAVRDAVEIAESIVGYAVERHPVDSE